MDTFHDRTVQAIEEQKEYARQYEKGYNQAWNEANARLLARQEAFNEADKRRVARIQELEDQLRLANVKIDLWKKQHNADQEIIDKLQAE